MKKGLYCYSTSSFKYSNDMLSSKVFQLCFLEYFAVNSKCNYATVVSAAGMSKKKKLSKMGGAIEKKILPVETDAKKLVSFVCGSNINNEGVDVELKPDGEYPDWLWNLYTGKPKRLEEMDPDSKEYWIKVKKLWMVHNNKLSKLKKF